jgi:alkanesulfonate monooxygenase SsuD/methylene tetrahydromethanopterin reductase-like flavin-dependent oxidoreductase (luciferase family)
MCDVAGIEALWVRDHLAPQDGEPRLEAWTALTIAAIGTARPRIGAMLDIGFRPPTTLAAMAGTLDVASGGRLELALSAGWSEREHLQFGFDFPDPETRVRRLERYTNILRRLLAGEAVAVGGPAEGGEAELGVASPQPGGPPLSIEALTPSHMELAARVADDVVMPASAVRDVPEALRRIAAACDRARRDPSTLGVALEVPVSIGRTRAEAHARAEGESAFRALGPPEEVGVFGTLEQCQERVIELAHAGVTDLRCVLPNTADVHDVIAQLTAVVVGSVDVLRPDAPRSKPPDPPKTWGGRGTWKGGAAEDLAIQQATKEGAEAHTEEGQGA